MFTVSVYAFHPLIQKFVRLWRYVQVVSDVLTFLLSMICCQCAGAMPLSTSSSCDTKPSIQVIQPEKMDPSSPLVDPGRASGEPLRAQDLVIDFTPQREDTPEIQAKCQEFWQFANKHPKLQGMMVQPSSDIRPPDPGRRLTELSSTSIQNHVHPLGHNLPAIHMMKKMNKKGVMKTALASSNFNRRFQ